MCRMDGESSLMRMERLKRGCETEVNERCMRRCLMKRRAGQLKEQESLEETLYRTF